MYEHYLDDFDFFHLGGDNMFVIAENLRYAASLMDNSAPIYMGAAMVDKAKPQKLFCGGGAGYTLNRVALKRLIEEDFNRKRCLPNGTRSDEDRTIGGCLRASIAWCHHNMDERNETRYHHFDVQFHAMWVQVHVSNWNWRELWKFHGIDEGKEKLEGISSTSVSFHLVGDSDFRDRGLRRYHALLYNLCPGNASKLFVKATP